MSKLPVTKLTQRATTLRAYADAVMGLGDLKVGPRSVSLLLIETAEFLEGMQRPKKRRALPKNFNVGRNRKP